MRKLTAFTAALVVTGVLSSLDVQAQSTNRGSGIRGSGSATQGSGSTTGQSVDNTFEGRFWRYLTASPFRYDEWAPFAGRSDGYYKGQSPHGAFVKVIANKIARHNPKQLPYGSILIKENYGADSKTLMAITVNVSHSRSQRSALGSTEPRLVLRQVHAFRSGHVFAA